MISTARLPGQLALRLPGQLALAGVCGLITLSVGACRCDNKPEPSSPTDTQPVEPPQKSFLHFPDDLHVEDDAINDFVTRAMNSCAGGDYQTFRLLWSARKEPLPRSEYEQGWQAIQEIRIRALQEVILAAEPPSTADTGENVYVILAEVRLDPTHPAAKDEPRRDLVLMLVLEHGEWRLAQAPKSMRAWIKERSRESDPPDSLPRLEPAGEAAPE